MTNPAPTPAPLPTLTADSPHGWYLCRWNLTPFLQVMHWDGQHLTETHPVGDGTLWSVGEFSDFTPLLPAPAPAVDVPPFPWPDNRNAELAIILSGIAHDNCKGHMQHNVGLTLIRAIRDFLRSPAPAVDEAQPRTEGT